MTIFEKLIKVQNELKAPKNQYNNFGKYAYRNCEDIQEALKPILLSNKCVCFLSDEIVNIECRFYVKAICTFIDAETGEQIQNTSFAREEDTKKGMDSSQITGSCSSYARKYALNGMFAIDDTKDADGTNKHGKEELEPSKPITNKPNSLLSDNQIKRLYTLARLAGFSREQVKEHIKIKFNIESTKDLTKVQYDQMCNGYKNAKK